MVSVWLNCSAAEVDELVAELYALGTTGIVECSDRLEAYFDTLEEAERLAETFTAREPRIVVHAPRDYVSEFQQSWVAVPIGERLWLAPPWDSGPPPEGRLRLDYQPGMACGSGAHPCTQMCLERLESELRPADSILDVGVGSGILLLAAGALGAGRKAGCDIDHDTVVIAAGNVDAALWTGSLRSVGVTFDVVVANISAPAVDLLLADLRRVAGRCLILSGFRTGEVKAEWGAFHSIECEGWACLVERRGECCSSGATNISCA